MSLNALQQAELEVIEELEPQLEENQEELRQRFRIESVDQLNWALRKLAAIKAKENEVKQLADAERQRIAEWEQRELAGLERSKQFFEALIHEYAMEQRKADPKWKSTSTPYGKIGFRKQPAKWGYNDEELLNYLKAAGRHEFIRVKEEVNKADLKKALIVKEGRAIDPETGEVVPGITVEEPGEKLVIQID
jgi:Mu-like prophage host-nuclease inhibitor protein Gam